MSSWVESVLNTAEWYVNNVNSYSSKKLYECPIENAGKVRADCSGFVSCCLRVAGVLPPGTNYSSDSFVSTSGKCAQCLKDAGFESFRYDFQKLQPFDIIAVSGHVEIFYQKYGRSGLSYAWGNNHYKTRGGLPCWMSKKSYVTIWRKLSEQDEISKIMSSNDILGTVNPGPEENNDDKNEKRIEDK